MENPIYDIEDHLTKNTEGCKYFFTNPWVVWKQYTSSNNSEEYVYTPKYRYSTIAGFWTLMNCINMENRTFFMRDGISPQWEDPKHENGAHLIITLDKKCNYYNIFLNCLLCIIGETFCNGTYESLKITGITYVNEPFLKQIRIWTSDENTPIYASMISDSFIEILKKSGITDISKRLKFVSFKSLKDKTKKTDRRREYLPCDKEYPNENKSPNSSLISSPIIGILKKSRISSTEYDKSKSVNTKIFSISLTEDEEINL